MRTQPAPLKSVSTEPFDSSPATLLPSAAPASPRVPTVGIGASAGGLEAFGQLLAHLPADTGMAFVLIQHLDPKHASRLGDLLAKGTSMPLVEATEGLVVRPDHVYVIPPNTTLTIAGGVLQLAPRGAAPHMPIDDFFGSLAADGHAGAIGVILSGSGSDGTHGLEEIKTAGGITLAQDEASAKYPGMPQSAVRGGSVDFVLSPEGIARELVRIGRHPYLHPYLSIPPLPRSDDRPASDPAAAAAEAEDEEQFQKILALLRASAGVDFSAYRDTMVRRRIRRRLVLGNRDRLADYVRLLESDAAELETLYQDILINVTRFFREPATFEALKQSVFPEIARAKAPGMPIRIWVPGCSSGQEAYSLAIALLELLDGQQVRFPIQIFATDLSDSRSLRQARAGVYPASIEADVSEERLRRFFTSDDGTYRISKAIRDMCVFARQNVAADPPFSRIDLISCRNLLIYLAPPLQKRVLSTFHYALNPNGFLLLGAAETVGPFSDLLELVDHRHRIFVKKATAVRQYPHFHSEKHAGAAGAGSAAPQAGSSADWHREADRIVLGEYAPAGVLIDDNLEVVHFRGQTGPYLAPAPGDASFNVLRMAREGLFLELRSALGECRQNNAPARRRGVRIHSGAGEVHELDLRVLPVRLPRAGERCFLILFENARQPGSASPQEAPEAARQPESGPRGLAGWLRRRLARAPAPARPAAAAGAAAASPSAGELEIDRLRQELVSTGEYLQSVIEEQESANEDLKSANEEILSANEELQSTNEELETAKEELQSVNEELTTVNEQLQYSNVELSRLNDDFTNLLGSASVPMVALGVDQRIRRFTPAAAKLLGLLPVDVGRPLGSLRSHLDEPELEALVAEVIATAQVQEREVRDRNGCWYALRIHPYRTAGDRIDGAVVVLVAIEEVKGAQERLRETSRLLAEADRRKDEFLATLAHELRNPLAPILNSLHLLEHLDSREAPAGKARGIVKRQVRHMVRLIDDLLDISRVTSGRIRLCRERVDLAGVVDQALEAVRPALETAEHTLEVHPSREPLAVEADPVRLVQIVENLLSNAIKYTARGAGAIELHTARRDGEAVLRVRDAGIGIAPEMLPLVWDLFMQVDPSYERSQSGLGIGLALVRSLVELHGGSVEVASAGLGRGSEFTVRLPLAAAAGAGESMGAGAPGDVETAGPPLPATPRAHRILVLDDNPDQAGSLTLLLSLWGHDVRMVHDGPAALEAAAAFRPEIVFLDIGLPGMDGHEVARRLRRDLGLGQAVLIALSGYGTDEDRRNSQEAGIDTHIVKPVDPEALRALLAGLGARVENGEPAPERAQQ